MTKRSLRRLLPLGRCNRCSSWGRLWTLWAKRDDGTLVRSELVCFACFIPPEQLELFAGLDASR